MITFLDGDDKTPPRNGQVESRSRNNNKNKMYHIINLLVFSRKQSN